MRESAPDDQVERLVAHVLEQAATRALGFEPCPGERSSISLLLGRACPDCGAVL